MTEVEDSLVLGESAGSSLVNSSQQPHSPAFLFRECMEVYRDLLVELSLNLPSPTGHTLERLFEEYSRLRIWGQQRRVLPSSTVPGSLASVLRDQPGLKRTVMMILEQVKSSLLQAESAALQNAEVSQDLEDVDSDGDSDEADDSDEDGPPRPLPLSRVIASLSESIKELYRLGSVLSRPRLLGRYLHSTRSLDQPFSVQQDYQHVVEKLRSWQRSRLENDMEEHTPPPSVPKEQEVATLEQIANRQAKEQDSDDPEWSLPRRLAQANTKRRLQLRYWEAHPYRPEETEAAPEGDVTQHSQRGHRSQPESRNGGDDRSTKPPPTVFSFSTVARSALFPNGLAAGPKNNDSTSTVYAMSSVGSHSTIRVPEAPLQEGESTFECPYCHMDLESEEMEVRLRWKRHVFRDLRPYSCTFVDCDNPDKLFATRYDWIYHELQMHRRQWDCLICQVSFLTRQTMADHLQAVHAIGEDKRRLSNLLEMSEGPIDEGRIQQCPFCNAAASVKRLLTHVAEHMEELALFALPRAGDDSDDGESNAALGHSHDLEDRHSSLPEELDTSHSSTPISSTDFLDILDDRPLEPPLDRPGGIASFHRHPPSRSSWHGGNSTEGPSSHNSQASEPTAEEDEDLEPDLQSKTDRLKRKTIQWEKEEIQYVERLKARMSSPRDDPVRLPRRFKFSYEYPEAEQEKSRDPPLVNEPPDRFAGDFQESEDYSARELERVERGRGIKKPRRNRRDSLPTLPHGVVTDPAIDEPSGRGGSKTEQSGEHDREPTSHGGKGIYVNGERVVDLDRRRPEVVVVGPQLIQREPLHRDTVLGREEAHVSASQEQSRSPPDETRRQRSYERQQGKRRAI